MSDAAGAELGQHLLFKGTPEAGQLTLKGSSFALGRPINVAEVKAYLAAQGVKFGCDDAALAKLLEQKTYNVEVVVAKCTPAVPGQDAQVDILISPESQAKPRIAADGKADYKEIDSIVQVKQGAVLAVKKKATDGKSGTDIFGKPIGAVPGKDMNLPCGINTRVLEDKLTLVADKAGYLFRQSGMLCVGETLVIPGDVDFKSGNIHFEGDVEVKGGVVEGFTVEAGGNVRILGEVDGATLISQKGNVLVAGGVFGKNKSRIEAKGVVNLVFAQQCKIKAGKVMVAKSLQDCDVETYELEAAAPECVVFGGKYLCYGSAKFSDLGSDAARTEVSILDEQEEKYRRDMARLDKDITKFQSEIEVHDKKLRTVKSILAKAADSRIPPKVAADIKASSEAFQQLRRAMTNAQSEKSVIETELAKPRTRSFSLGIKGDIHGSVHLDMFHIRKLLENADSRKTFQVLPERGLFAFDFQG